MEANLATPLDNSKADTPAPLPKLCIVRGAHRLNGADWSAIHAIVLQGYFAIRKGNDVIVHYADVEEGHA